MVLRLIVFCMVLSVAADAHALGRKRPRDAKYLSIDKVELTEEFEAADLELPEPFSVGPAPSGRHAFAPVTILPTGRADEIIVILERIVNLGKEIWAIIEANRPVVNIKRDTASAVPDGVQHWSQLQGWSAPVSKSYRATYTNMLGQKVVDFPFRVVYTYGGNVQGKGKFLTNVTIAPKDLSVSWGYKFDANVEVASVTNAGTHQNPVGAVEIAIHWTANSPLRHMQGSEGFYVRGDGMFLRLDGGTR